MKTTRTLVTGVIAMAVAAITFLVMNGTVYASASHNDTDTSPTEQNEQSYLQPAIAGLKRQFAHQELATVSVNFSLENVAADSSFTVVDASGTTYVWSAGDGRFVEDHAATVWPLEEGERAFTPEQISWDALLQRAHAAPSRFGDPSLIIGSLRIFASMGQAVTATDISFTSADPELKPSMTLTLDGKLIGVSCPAGTGCEWLDAA